MAFNLSNIKTPKFLKPLFGELLFKKESKGIGLLSPETLKYFPESLKETIEKPAETYQKYLEQGQEERLQKQIVSGKQPSPTLRYFTEELGTKWPVVAIEAVKWTPKTIAKVVKNYKDIPYQAKGIETKPGYVPLIGEITGYGEDVQKLQKEFEKQGIDEDIASWAAASRIIGFAALDMIGLYGSLTRGTDFLKRNLTPELQQRIDAWKVLGQPKTPAEQNATWKQLSQQFHPDKLGGNATVQTKLNQANDILKSAGIPTQKDLLKFYAGQAGAKATAPISQLMQRPPTPEALPFAALPERAGYTPTQAYQPAYQPKMGLGVREMPLEPIKPIPEASKALARIEEIKKEMVGVLPGSSAHNALIKEMAALKETPKPSSSDEFLTELYPAEPELPEVAKKEAREWGAGMPQSLMKDKIEEAESEVWQELIASEAGGRIPIRDERGVVQGVLGKPSTFPKWIPEKLRDKKTVEAVAEHLLNQTEPTKVKEKSLYDIAKKQVLEKAGISEDSFQALLKYRSPEFAKVRSIAPPTSEYAFNINLDKFKVSKGGKEFLKEAVKEIQPELEKIKGQPLTHDEVLEEANKANILSSAITREQQMSQEVAVYNLQKKVARLSSYLDKNKNAPEGLWQEYLVSLKDLSAQTTAAGRMLESLKVSASDKSTKEILLEDIFKKTRISIDKIATEASGVDFDNLREAQIFYRKFVKPTKTEILNEYRYINLLSSPKTNIVNALGGILQIPIEAGVKLYSGAIDRVASILPSKQRSHYVSEITPWTKGLVNSIPEAFENFKLAFEGKKMVEVPRERGLSDVFKRPALTKGLWWKIKTPIRLMESFDIFFHTIFKNAEKEALAYRFAKQGRDIDPLEIEKMADDKALYLIFRGYGGTSLPVRQGKVLDAIDKTTSALYKWGNDLPIVRWFVPFVQTPVQVAKQGIELSPFGAFDLPGSEDKVDKLARIALGGTIMAAATTFALDDKITWSVPSGEKERQYFYASGKKPYSIKIGDNWVSYQTIGAAAYPVAFVAAIKHYSDEKGMSDKQIEVIFNTTVGLAGFFSDQTYLQGMGDLYKAVSGSEWEGKYYAKRVLTNVPRQLIPFSSFQGWLARILDDTYRDPDTAWETIKVQLPLVSKTVPAYTTPTGEPSKRKYPIFSAFSPITVSPEDPFYTKIYEDYKRDLEAQRKKKEEKEARAGEEIDYSYLDEILGGKKSKGLESPSQPQFDYLDEILRGGF